MKFKLFLSVMLVTEKVFSQAAYWRETTERFHGDDDVSFFDSLLGLIILAVIVFLGLACFAFLKELFTPASKRYEEEAERILRSKAVSNVNYQTYYVNADYKRLFIRGYNDGASGHYPDSFYYCAKYPSKFYKNKETPSNLAYTDGFEEGRSRR